MKFLIAGYGSIGRRHLNNLLTLGYSDIVLYRTHQSTISDEAVKDIPVETDLAKALDHKPDAVVISNPTAKHFDVAIPAAKAGCHILFEKPISHNFDGLEDLKSALKSGGGKVLVGYQFRFHPGIRAVREILIKKILGLPLSARCEWGEYLPGWHPWEDYRKSYSARKDLGGGVVLTLSHPIDYLRWLLGEVQSLWAISGNVSSLELQVEDFAEVGFKFETGCVTSLHLDYYQRPPTHKFKIVCDEGVIKWNNENGNVIILKEDGKIVEYFTLPNDFERNQLFVEEMQHFIDVINGKTEPICSLNDGEKALVLSWAILNSSRHGQQITV